MGEQVVDAVSAERIGCHNLDLRSGLFSVEWLESLRQQLSSRVGFPQGCFKETGFGPFLKPTVNGTLGWKTTW